MRYYAAMPCCGFIIVAIFTAAMIADNELNIIRILVFLNTE